MNNIDDKYIIKYFFNSRGYINKKKLINIPEDINNYILNRYSDSLSIFETIKRIKFKEETHPLCPICGKPVVVYDKLHSGSIFGKFCSKSCLSKSNSLKIEKKFGTKSTLTLPEIKEKTIKTLEKHYGTGVIHNWKSKEVHKQRINTCYKKYGEDYFSNYINKKAKETCLKLYGNKNYRNIEKAKETFKKHYGVDHPLKHITKNDKNKLTSKQLSKIINLKQQLNNTRLKTIKENNTWNISTIEKKLCKYFLDNNINYIYQYKSELYPWNCDFYLKDYDLYIEIQGNWTHGFHPFNENNNEDVKQLNEWNEKYKTHPYYKNAINTWTINDIKKRNKAKENNLNYLEIFSIDLNECINIINNEIKKLLQ